MRNFFHNFPFSKVVVIDFNQSEKILAAISDELAHELLKAFETATFKDMTPSEEGVMFEFLNWFNVFRDRGLAINASYPRMSNNADLPANTAFTYVNCNTGIGYVFIGIYDDGYGECTFGGRRV